MADPTLVVDPGPEVDDALVRLLRSAYVDEGFVEPSVAAEHMTAARVRARGALVVATGAAGVLGCVVVVPPDSEAGQIAGPREWELHLLAVESASRGQGIGRRLVEHAVARSVEAGAVRVVLSTQPEMAAAQRLYARCGFQRAPSRDWAVRGAPRWAYVWTPPGLWL